MRITFSSWLLFVYAASCVLILSERPIRSDSYPKIPHQIQGLQRHIRAPLQKRLPGISFQPVMALSSFPTYCNYTIKPCAGISGQHLISTACAEVTFFYQHSQQSNRECQRRLYPSADNKKPATYEGLRVYICRRISPDLELVAMQGLEPRTPRI